jgi:signal transduction histidine kinase/DNA-binding response OmpR family regulator
MSSRPKVLIVDDQARNLDVLEAMLAPSDCTPIRALSADEALLSLLRHDFAAMVLDIRMPGMNGLDLARLIKQRKRSQGVPILFLTAHMVDEADMLRGYDAGAVDYLSKPVNPDVLRSKVGVFIDLFRKTRELAQVNEALQNEIAAREKAQEALQSSNQDLERRVLERTAALTRAHQAVRENEERLRMAIEVAQIAAWDWHLPSGQMTWSTDPELLFGFPKGSFGPELRMSRTLHPDERSRVEESLTNALRSGAYEAEYRAVRPDGTIVWITERGRVVWDADGLPDRMVGISRDVSAEREAEREREELLRSEREARDQAEHQMRLKDEFLATVSHELRTPMNAILGWLSILESGKAVGGRESALAVIQRNAQIQAKLIDDLLDMTRLVSGNIQLEWSAVAPLDVVEAAIASLRPAADAKGIQIATSGDPAGGPIHADARRLQQILWNLLHNAIKFNHPGGRITSRVERCERRVRFVVEDDGRGVSQEFLPHVFEKFRRQDSSSTRDSDGLGLGLAIAKHLVDLHGGTIRAESAGDGKGATFIVELPADAPAQSVDGGSGLNVPVEFQ